MTSLKPLPDAVSDVVSLLGTRSDFVCASECAAPYSLSFRSRKAHFHIVEQGAPYLQLQGQPPIRIRCGDLAILPRGAGHVVSSDPMLVPVPIERAFGDLAIGGGRMVRIGRASALQTRTVCGQFAFEGALAPRVLTVLPQLIHIRCRDRQPSEWLSLTSAILAAEARSATPGATAVVDRLLEVLLVQALRQWVSHGHGAHGWLAGLTYPQVGKALAAIHEDPVRSGRLSTRRRGGRAWLRRRSVPPVV